ncbi:helix-turn-helix domain-containing protein, partial [Bacteroides acidifaciens]|uniref:helix-turn-helix domain-containing protein n=1 Tax=Bacteroides acidifaciens TaxID=85831 RepID=UPI0026775876
NVVEFAKSTRTFEYIRMNIGFYCLFLKEANCGDLRYGRKYYDYQEGTVVCMAPGQVVGIDNRNQAPVRTQSIGVLFHPDLIRGTSLGQNIKNYSFFSYEVSEALHLSDQEKEIVTDCIHKIQIELEHAIDKHSKQLIVRNIELLLDYCMRFYERQFITRNQVNKDIIVRFEHLLDEYFQGQAAMNEGLPSVKYFADKVCLSPNYFGDLIKKETGKTAQEYIQCQIIELAKERILEGNQTVSQIAYELGFQYPQHFSRLFKKHVGCTPNEYKQNN